MLVGVDVDTTPEIQTIVNAQIASATVLAEIGADDDASNSDVSITDLNKILPVLTDVNVSNEAAYRLYIVNPANRFSNPATQAEVQAMVDAVNILESFVAPDYYPTMSLVGSIITGATGNIKIEIKISESIKGGVNTGDLRFSVLKNRNLALTLDNTVTGSDNSNWALSDIGSVYLLTYIGHGGKFPSFTESLVTFDAVFTSPPSSKGKFTLEATIASGSGDRDNSNNKDEEVVEYNNL
jgi:hypothetical protein